MAEGAEDFLRRRCGAGRRGGRPRGPSVHSDVAERDFLIRVMRDKARPAASGRSCVSGPGSAPGRTSPAPGWSGPWERMGFAAWEILVDGIQYWGVELTSINFDRSKCFGHYQVWFLHNPCAFGNIVP